MNRFSTLQFRLSALLFSFGCLLIAMSAVRHFWQEVRTENDQMRRDAYIEGTRLSGLSQHFLRKRLTQAADLAISYVSVQPEVQLGVMCDGANVIRHATEKQWCNVALKDSSLAELQPLVDKARISMQGHIEEMDGGKRLIAIFPFWDFASFLSKGVVILDYDLEGSVLIARKRVWHESFVQACFLLGGCMLLWSLLHVLVTSRVRRIVDQTMQSGTDSPIPSPIGGDDELGLISHGIAEAFRRLQTTERKFSQIAANMRDVFWIAPREREEPMYVNAAYEPLFGRFAAKLQHHRWDWLRSLAREDRRTALEMLAHLRRQAGEINLELRLHGKVNQPRWIQCRAFSVVRDGANSGLRHVVGVVMDITERKDIERRLLEVAEQERRRIGQDLHDDVCQRLSAAQLKCGVLQSALGRMALPQGLLAGEVARELSEATEIAREFALGLAPIAMGPEALPEAFRGLSIFLQRAFGVKCVTSCDSLESDVSAEVAAQIYRVAQELATNAAKHSHPSWIEISLTKEELDLRLEVSHNGSQFDPKVRSENRGMGLHIMQQRVDAMGATLVFHRRLEEDGGTIAVCEIPLAYRK